MTRRRETRAVKASNPSSIARAAIGITKQHKNISTKTLLKDLKQAKKDVREDTKKQEKKIVYSMKGNKIAVKGGHGPIHGSMDSVRAVRYDLKLMELAMSLELEDVLREGEKEPLAGVFKNMKAVHFTSNAKLTAVCDDATGFDPSRHAHDGTLSFEVNTKDIQNKAKDGSPGKYEQADVNCAHRFYDKTCLSKIYDDFNGQVDRKLLFAPRDFYKNFRFQSMIFTGANATLKTNLEHFVDSFQSKMGTRAESVTEQDELTAMKSRLKNSIVQSICNIANQENQSDVFIFNTGVDNRLFYTKNYEVCLSQTNARRVFKEGSEEYEVKVYRKMIFASLNEKTIKHKDTTYNIPLCEEMVIHMYKRADNESVLFERACLISAKLKLANTSTTASPHTTQWHYLGKNAFTVNHPSDACIRANSHERAMFMSGFIAKRLADVNAGSKVVSDSAVEFFKELLEDTVDTAEKVVGAITRDSAMTTKILTALEKSHLQNHTAGNNPPDSDFKNKITANSILKKSFLAVQHADKLTYVNGDKYFYTRQCFASFSFCITVLSPFENPAINAVFVGAYGAAASFLKGSSSTTVTPVDYTCKPRNLLEEEPQPPAQAVSAQEDVPGGGAPSKAVPVLQRQNNIRDEVLKNPTRAGSQFHQPYRHTARDIITNSGSRFSRPFHNSTLPPELELELELL